MNPRVERFLTASLIFVATPVAWWALVVWLITRAT